MAFLTLHCCGYISPSCFYALRESGQISGFSFVLTLDQRIETSALCILGKHFATKYIFILGSFETRSDCSPSLRGTGSDPSTSVFQPGLEGVVTGLHIPTLSFLNFLM